MNDAVFVGLSNYAKAISDPEFLHAFWFTALFAVTTVVLINLLGFLVALAFTQNFKGINIFRTVFFMPNLIGGIVLGYIWQLNFNGVLAYFGTTLKISTFWGFWGLVILVCWQQIGYMMIIYIAGLQAIPGDLTEAAPDRRRQRLAAADPCDFAQYDALYHHLHLSHFDQRLQAV